MDSSNSPMRYLVLPAPPRQVKKLRPGEVQYLALYCIAGVYTQANPERMEVKRLHRKEEGQWC